MRMVNDRDQAILRSAVSDAAANLLDFVPSLGTGEVFAFGEGVALPARVKLKPLPSQMLPKSDASGGSLREQSAGLNEEFFAAVLKRWRGVSAKPQLGIDEGSTEAQEQETSDRGTASAGSGGGDKSPEPAQAPAGRKHGYFSSVSSSRQTRSLA